MEDNNFDLKKFLTENRLTQATRLQNPTVKEDRYDDLVYYGRDDDNNLTIKGPGGPGGPGDGGDDDWWDDGGDDGGDWEQGEESFEGGVIVTFESGTGKPLGIVPQIEGMNMSEIEIWKDYVRLHVGDPRFARRIYYAYHDAMQLDRHYNKEELNEFFKEVDLFLENRFNINLYQFFVEEVGMSENVAERLSSVYMSYRN